MVKQVLGLVAALMLAGMAAGQSVSAVPKLDMNKLMGSWYEVARLPDKLEKHCVSEGMVLYALGDKPNRFQMVTSCAMKDGIPNAWNASGKAANKRGDGQMKVTYVWPFSAKYWVLATGPEFEWVLVGSPNHKALWVLSRTAAMKPEVLAEIQGKAAAEGFNMAKLMMVSQRH
jgi:apolipoprotein D and lipocalin family protein